MTTTTLETGLSLHCERVGHVYSTPTGDTVALQDVTLTVRAGETIAVLGPSGSGKSSPTSEASVSVAGTAEDNVRFAQRGVRGFRRASLPTPAVLLHALGLTHLAGRAVGGFSGGEQQRLAVAMGMATSPGLLLVDEPTSQLDKTNRDAVVELIAVVGRQFGTTVVVVTHDPEVAEQLGRTITITQGRADDETQHWQQHVDVDLDGRVQLPDDVLRLLPPGTRARVVRRPNGVELVREDETEGGR